MTERYEGNLADDIDRASDLEMKMTEAAILATRARNQQKQVPDSDGVYAITECVECDGEIGEGRLAAAANNTLCIFCATAAERRR